MPAISILAITVAGSLLGAPSAAQAVGSGNSLGALENLQLSIDTENPAFAGVNFNSVKGVIDLWVTDTGAVPAITHRPSGDPSFVVHTAPRPLSALYSIQDQMLADRYSQDRDGFFMQSDYPDIFHSQVVARVTGDLARATATLSAEFGAAVRTEQSTSEDVLHLAATRLSDVAPFNGGDFIATPLGSCTSGPGIHVTSSNKDYLLTDAHCTQSTATGQVIKNGYYDSAGHLQGGGSTIGTVAATKWPANNANVGFRDTMLISASTSPLDFGINNIAYHQTSVGAKAAQMGLHVCASGAFEDQICPAASVVIGFNRNSASGNGNTIVGLTEVADSAPTVIIGEGDSGGPVWHSDGLQTLTIFGVIEGYSSPSVNCPHYTFRGAVCGTNLFYTDMSDLLATWSATLKT